MGCWTGSSKHGRVRSPLAGIARPAATCMSKEDQIELEGVVKEVLTGGVFRVEVEDGHEVLAHLAGKMRKFRIRVVLGDRVTVAVSPYDPTRGRVIFRHR